MIPLSTAFNWIVSLLIAFIAKAGYWGIGALMALESANIPIPSEIVMPFAGYLVFEEKFSFIWVVLAGAVGNLVGSLGSYALGAWGGRAFVARHGRFLGLSLGGIEQGERWMARYGSSVVLFSRLLPVVRTFISFPAGVLRMNIWKFSLYTLAGSLMWNYALSYAGVIAGKNWTMLQSFFHAFDWLLISAIIAVGVWWVFRRRAS